MTPPAIPGKRKTKWPVAVLGATGAVGQMFVRLLADHPWFEIIELAASERSAGKKYSEATRWLEGPPPPAPIQNRRVIACDPGVISAPIVFSALDAVVAGEVELAFAKAGKFVLSNAKNFRMEPDVPLVIPEVNGDHLALIECQRKRRGWDGAIVTNANCSATVTAVALAPLHQKFGIRQLFLSTMQAISGAGYPGVPSWDILGNVIPYIADEEPKLEREVLKLLGTFADGEVTSAAFKVSAHTNRVAVEHGHTICMTIGFEEKPSPEAAVDCMKSWEGLSSTTGLPTRPASIARLERVVSPARGPRPRPPAGGARFRFLWQRIETAPGRCWRESPAVATRTKGFGFDASRRIPRSGLSTLETLIPSNAYAQPFEIFVDRPQALHRELGQRFMHVDDIARRH